MMLPDGEGVEDMEALLQPVPRAVTEGEGVVKEDTLVQPEAETLCMGVRVPWGVCDELSEALPVEDSEAEPLLLSTEVALAQVEGEGELEPDSEASADAEVQIVAEG